MGTSKQMSYKFPHSPLPTRVGCSEGLSKLTVPAASRRNCSDASGPGETPVILGPTTTVQGNGADGSVASFPAFVSAGSTVVRVTTGNHHSPKAATDGLLTELHNRSAPLPVSVWALKNGYGSGDKTSLFCVYRTHQEACEALCSSTINHLFGVFPALDADLQPFAKLQLIHLERRPPDSSLPPQLPFSLETNSPIISLPPPLRFSSDIVAPMQHGFGGFALSSNPPNPKANFWFGDWICPSVSCAAHNFGRNPSCIGCGVTRPAVSSLAIQQQGRVPPPQRFSPRFSSLESARDCIDITLDGPGTHPPIHPSKPSQNSIPIQLTPSGTQICMGGKVQNISNNPLAPCYMFWSFNEPLPDPGQIRPTLSVALQHPPILNTGNRGPIEHQPGDWNCKKCNYLNWRRRKVCQTCYPYAEGNDDSIPASVQAERIALLASTIRGREFHSLPPSPSCVIREQPARRSSLQFQALATAQQLNNDACRKHLLTSRQRSDVFLKTRQPSPSIGNQSLENPKKLYQTFGNGSSPMIIPSSAADSSIDEGVAGSLPGPLLPSFLQDIVQSPSLSPASSTDFSLEDYNNDEMEPRFIRFNEGGTNITHPGQSLHSSLALKSTTSLTNMYNIWRLGGDETKGW